MTMDTGGTKTRLTGAGGGSSWRYIQSKKSSSIPNKELKNERPTVSVVLASYNGAEFIEEQILSITDQLSYDDELIVTDDGSTDETGIIVKNIIENHPDFSISFVEGPKLGVIYNFANGICVARNEFIFLSDQDDLWLPGKIDRVLRVFDEEPDLMLITHDAYVGDRNFILDGRTLLQHAKNGFIRNFFKSSYFGCCMCARKGFLTDLLPEMIMSPAHDHFISLIAEEKHGSYFLREPFLIRRVHGDNLTHKLNLYEKIKFRIQLLHAVVHYNVRTMGSQH